MVMLVNRPIIHMLVPSVGGYFLPLCPPCRRGHFTSFNCIVASSACLIGLGYRMISIYAVSDRKVTVVKEVTMGQHQSNTNSENILNDIKTSKFLLYVHVNVFGIKNYFILSAAIVRECKEKIDV